MKNVLLIGAYGYGNCGDDALKNIILRNLDLPAVDIRCMSPGMENPFGNGRIDISILGGGGTIYDDPIENLYNYLELLELGKQKIVFNVGIQGMITNFGLSLLVKHFSNAIYVSVRDLVSRNILSELGINSVLGADPVFLQDEYTPFNISIIDDKRDNVGFILHGYEGSSNDALINRVNGITKSNYEDLITETIREFAKTNNVILFVFSNDDRDLANKIYNEVKGVNVVPYSLADGKLLHIEKIVFLISMCKYIVTGRFHGAIFSMLTNTPFLMIGRTNCIEMLSTKLQRLSIELDIPTTIMDINSINYSDMLYFLQFNSQNVYLRDKLSHCLGKYKDRVNRTFDDIKYIIGGLNEDS